MSDVAYPFLTDAHFLHITCIFLVMTFKPDWIISLFADMGHISFGPSILFDLSDAPFTVVYVITM